MKRLVIVVLLVSLFGVALPAGPLFEARQDLAVGVMSYGEIDPATGLHLDRSPTAVAIGDVDGDGAADLVAPANAADFVSIFVNQDGEGLLGPIPVDATAVGLNPRDLLLRDLNGDARADLLVTFPGENMLGVALASGTAPYFPVSSFTKYPTGRNPYDLMLSDLNGDGRNDVVVVNRSDETVSVFKGAAGGVLSLKATVSVGSAGSDPVAAAALDTDGDGDREIIVANRGGNSLVMMKNQGGFSFQAAQLLVAATAPSALVGTDLNGDSVDDLAYAEEGPSTVSVLLGNGSSLVAAGTFQVGSGPLGLASSDFDQDGLPDLVTADSTADTISVLLQDGGGSFSFFQKVSYPVGARPVAVAVGDIDGDGAADICSANILSHNVSLLLNRGDGSLAVDEELSTVGHSGSGGSGPVAAALAERDGKPGPELCTVNQLTPDGSVFLNDGSGNFVAPSDPAGSTSQLPSAPSPAEILGADIDGDGRGEVITVGGAQVVISVGSGGTITKNVGGVVALVAAELAKVDADAFEDLIVLDRGDAGSSTAGHLYVLYGTGNPATMFGAPVNVPLPGLTGTSDPIDLFVGKLNGDGSPDAAVLYRNGGNVAILVGSGGTFAAGPAPTIYTVGRPPTATIPAPKPTAIDGGDLDGDGDADLAVSDTSQNLATVLPNDGGAAFGGAPAYLQLRSLGGDDLAVGDFDGDGRDDVAVLSTFDENVSTFLSAGSMGFQDPEAAGLDGGPAGILVFDREGDGDGDIAAADFQIDALSILRSQARMAPVILTSPGPGTTNPATLKPYRSDGVALLNLAVTAFQTPPPFGANIGAANLTGSGSGMQRILAGPGPGSQAPARVRAFNPAGTAFSVDIIAYSAGGFGVNVHGAELDGDARSEFVTGPGPGAVYGPHVRGWQFSGGTNASPMGKVSFFAYGTLKFGAGVGASDLDSDGFDEIVTGAGPGAVFGPHVRGWNFDGASIARISRINFFAYKTLKFGVNARSGDLDGDGFDEIVTGPGPGQVFATVLRAFNYDGGTVTSISKVNAVVFSQWRYGLNVEGGDLDGDGFAEILTGQGDDPAGDARMKAFNYDGVRLQSILPLDRIAFAGFKYGVNVASANYGRFAR